MVARIHLHYGPPCNMKQNMNFLLEQILDRLFGMPFFPKNTRHCSAEGASKMRHLSATVLTSQNERFLYIFSQKIIFLKIRRALCELCRFVTIVYKRQFRGFPTLQILTFWLQKKNFTKNY